MHNPYQKRFPVIIPLAYVLKRHNFQRLTSNCISNLLEFADRDMLGSMCIYSTSVQLFHIQIGKQYFETTLPYNPEMLVYTVSTSVDPDYLMDVYNNSSYPNAYGLKQDVVVSKAVLRKLKTAVTTLKAVSTGAKITYANDVWKLLSNTLRGTAVLQNMKDTKNIGEVPNDGECVVSVWDIEPRINTPEEREQAVDTTKKKILTA